jgi:hypothetical protein
MMYDGAMMSEMGRVVCCDDDVPRLEVVWMAMTLEGNNAHHRRDDDDDDFSHIPRRREAQGSQAGCTYLLSLRRPSCPWGIGFEKYSRIEACVENFFAQQQLTWLCSMTKWQDCVRNAK